MTAGGRLSIARVARNAGMNAAIFLLSRHTAAPARRPHHEDSKAGPKMHEKRQNQAPEAGSVLTRRPNVLPIPARDEGGGI